MAESVRPIEHVDEQVRVGTNQRVEVLFPVLDPLLTEQIKLGILNIYHADNVKARFLQADGSYLRKQPKPDEKARHAQQRLQDKLSLPLVET